MKKNIKSEMKYVILMLSIWLVISYVSFFLNTPLSYIKFPITILGASILLFAISGKIAFYYRYLLLLLLAFVCTLLMEDVVEAYSIVGSLVVAFIGYKNDL